MNAFYRLISSPDMAQERISGLEARSIETSQMEIQRQKKDEDEILEQNIEEW